MESAMQPLGVMFHHFRDDRHPPGQGAISADELHALLDFVGPERIRPAREWLRRALTGALEPTDVCLTFDDNLRCQFDVAGPVLAARGMTAFWFVPTSVLEGNLEPLEIYRAFRLRYFAAVEDFYAAFERAVTRTPEGPRAAQALAAFDPQTYLVGFPFYTPADRRFRFLRDEVLGPARYHAVMDAMLAAAGVDLAALARDLWMTPGQIRALHADGHVIGLHSHTHPTRLAHLSPAEQLREYTLNRDYLARLLGTPPVAMSHPCNSYTPDTLRILGELGLRLGFRANVAQPVHGPLEYPREDHANIVREMQACASPCSPVTSLATAL